MHVLITCKYQKDQIENSQERLDTPISSLQVYGDIFRYSRADNPRVSPIWPKFEPFLDIMHVLANYKKLIGSIANEKKRRHQFFKPGVVGSIPGFFSLSGETLNRGPMTIFQDKLLTRTYCDEADDYMHYLMCQVHGT